jgi:hypothetical protein
LLHSTLFMFRHTIWWCYISNNSYVQTPTQNSKPPKNLFAYLAKVKHNNSIWYIKRVQLQTWNTKINPCRSYCWVLLPSTIIKDTQFLFLTATQYLQTHIVFSLIMCKHGYALWSIMVLEHQLICFTFVAWQESNSDKRTRLNVLMKLKRWVCSSNF